MFTETGAYYDAFYDAAGKDYATESAKLLECIRARLPAARTLLDVACGTGRHLEYLSRELDCVGVDIDPVLLAIAQGRCCHVRFMQADMTELDLGERFDVVTCLFSSIGYTREPERLGKAVAAMAAHLRPGGLLIVERSFAPDQWEPGRIDGLYIDTDELKATRLGVADRQADVAVLDLHYLIGAAEGIRYAHERHELGLFTTEQYRRAFAEADLDFQVDEQGLRGRGLVLGTRKASSM